MPKKSGLGKGLGSLMGEANAETKSVSRETLLRMSLIHPNPDQPRTVFLESELNELSESILANGLIQPIIVRKDDEGYEIIAGERRYQAAKKAKLKEIPAIIRDIAEKDVFKLALIENLQRSDLTPLEEARAYKKLIDEESLTQEALSKMISKSRPAIANTLRLLDLPYEVQTLIEAGQLSAGHARAILAVASDDGKIKLAQKVAAEGLSVRETEKLAPLFSGEIQSTKTKSTTPQSYKRAAKFLRSSLSAGVKVRQVRGRNKIEIEFIDEEDLARIIKLITREDSNE